MVIIAMVGLAYFYFASNSTPSNSSSIVGTDSATAQAGTRVLNLLNQVQSLKLDTTFFKDPGYNTLVDYSVEIPPVNVGRPNPFAPLPGYTASVRNAR